MSMEQKVEDGETLEERAFEQYVYVKHRVYALERDPRCPSHVLTMVKRAAGILFATYEAIRMDVQ